MNYWKINNSPSEFNIHFHIFFPKKRKKKKKNRSFQIFFGKLFVLAHITYAVSLQNLRSHKVVSWTKVPPTSPLALWERETKLAVANLVSFVLCLAGAASVGAHLFFYKIGGSARQGRDRWGRGWVGGDGGPFFGTHRWPEPQSFVV